MKQWIVKKSTTADAIIKAISKGTCTTDKQVEQIAVNCGDEVYWIGSLTDHSPLDASSALMELGIPCHLNGFRYLVDAVTIAAERGNCGVTKYLYPQVAKNYGKTPAQVERSIRHAVETAFNRGDPETLYKYFGNSTSADKGKATNSEFIFALARRL